MTTAIALERVSKRYRARVALSEVSFAVEPGEIVGLLGPNGAGKSTTLGILSTGVRFDEGTVTVGGAHLPGDAPAARRTLGLVPQEIAVYPTLSAVENLRFFGRCLGLDRQAARARAAEALELVGLADRAREPVVRFSVGMRRRLSLACGVLHSPRVLLLDEATVGIDPQSRERVFTVTRDLARRGAAVLWSTHDMAEAERLCRRVVLLDRGRVVASGAPEALVAGLGRVPEIRLRTRHPLPPGWLDGTAGTRVAESAGVAVTVAVRDVTLVPAVLAAVTARGGDVVELVLHRPDLADAFFALTGHALRDEADGGRSAS